MGIPAADIGKTNRVFVFHELRNSARFEFKSLCGNRIAVGRIYLAGHFSHHVVPDDESFNYLLRQRRAFVHRCNDIALTGINCRLANRSQRGVWHLHAALQYQRQLVSKGNGTGAVERGSESVKETGSVIPTAVKRLTQFDAVLRFEMTARHIFRSCERNEGGLAIREQW